MGEPTKSRRRSGTAQHLTPLMRASEMGHEDIIDCLLEARASPTQCDSHGWTPLCYALAAGEVGVARVLANRLDKTKLRAQKEIIHKHRSDVLTKCEKEAGTEASQIV